MSNSHIKRTALLPIIILLGLATQSSPLSAAVANLATAPMVTTTTATVLPNIFLMMDDSGSMAWDYMPDNAGNFGANQYGAASYQCNGVFYNPSITYLPPVNSNGTSFANASFTAAWVDGFATASGTVNLNTSFVDAGGDSAQMAFYYYYSGAQTTEKLKDYYNTNSTFYSECNSNVGATPGSSVFAKRRLSTTSATTISVSGSGNTSVSSITVNGVQLMSGTSTSSSNTTTVASNVSAKITLNGFSATSSGSTVTITGPASATNYTPVITKSGNMAFTTDAFPDSTAANLTNFANWYSFYRTRILMMKTATGLAFKPICPVTSPATTCNYRVGLATMNNNTGSDILPLAPFDTAQKATWYNKLYATNANNSTPLREALSNVGRMYAHKLPSNQLNGLSIPDPIEYSCQQNFTILTTDGFWNGSTTYNLSGGTVGNQDGTEPRPMYDGTATSNTLADVAEYYYKTDLRTTALGNCTSVLGTTICSSANPDPLNNVPTSGLDAASTQHMTTFTLGLGARGKMVFDPSYQSAITGDYVAIKNGSTATASVCTWQNASTVCNWPIPASNSVNNIDDLWHTAVNGRGTYFSATNPDSLALGLSAALAGVSARTGSSAAATTSTAFITQGDNFLFSSSYVSLNWTGELIRKQLDPTTGAVLVTADWSAKTKLDTQTAAVTDSRNIYMFDNTAASQLKSFIWSNLSVTQRTYFDLSKIQLLSQSCGSGSTCLSTADQSLAADTNLVNYLRGQRGNEGALADNTKYYRQRINILGDIVDSESVYVRGAVASFNDIGYSAFSSSAAITARKAMVYVGANDGMLHAIRATDDPSTAAINEGGQEDWAYIPSMVLSNLYKLADKNYGLNHQFFVDGSPAVADICFRNCTTAGASDWKTILVGGLNLGGMGYYALDITDPANPKALWEFTDSNLGYSYGNPKIVKLKDGTWVVVISSGYNNTAGDGQGHLFILNANTGAIIHNMTTGVGSTSTPSNLGRIDIPVASPGVDATGLAAYGGDMAGNVWRFDINGADTTVPARWTDIGNSGFDVQLLATLRDPSGNAQPITAKPLITLAGTSLLVNIGTGRYLGAPDLTDISQQSFYAIKDTLAAGTTPATPIFNNPRTLASFVQQTQTATLCPANSPASICSVNQSVITSSTNAVDLVSKNGWYFDFSLSGERDNTDATVSKGTILLTTNIPNSNSCSVGGESYLYQLNYLTGAAISSSTTNVTAIKLGNELASRPVVAYLPDGTAVVYVQKSGGGDPTSSSVWQNNASTGVSRRVSWRELIP